MIGHYLCIKDTLTEKPIIARVTVVAELPNESFSSNYCTEVNVISTGIEIVKV